MNNISQISIFDYSEIENSEKRVNFNNLTRIVCGLSEGKYKYLKSIKHLVLPARVFTGFLNKLKKYEKELDKIFEELVKFMYENLEGFGEDCAIDGKYLDTYANLMGEAGYDKENNALRYTRC